MTKALLMAPPFLDADPASGHQVPLTAGADTPIAVVVTAENGAIKGYTVMVYREKLVKSDDATLSSLVLNDADGDDIMPATGPGVFASTNMTYSINVLNDVSVVTVAANTSNLGAVAVITPPDQDSLATATGHQVLLRAGAETNIMVAVTAEDGTTTETYSVTIYRARTQPSSDADLSALSLSGVTLSSAFDSAKTFLHGKGAIQH